MEEQPKPTSRVRRPSYWKPLLALGAVSVAFGLTYFWEPNGLDFSIDGSARAQEVREQAAYDLTELRVMNRVILHVKNHYVEPERINPQRMLLAGLNAVQREVAPVLVDYEEGQSHLTLPVGVFIDHILVGSPSLF